MFALSIFRSSARLFSTFDKFTLTSDGTLETPLATALPALFTPSIADEVVLQADKEMSAAIAAKPLITRIQTFPLFWPTNALPGQMVSESSGGGRQSHAHRGAHAQSAADVERTAVPLDDMLDDGEPQASATRFAATGLVRPVKALGNARQMLPRDPRPVIGDADLHPAAVPSRFDVDPRT